MTEKKNLTKKEKQNDINVLLDAEMMDAVIGGKCDNGCSKACASQCKHACATSSKTTISLPPIEETKDTTVVKQKIEDNTQFDLDIMK